jgi:hypothetical protein
MATDSELVEIRFYVPRDVFNVFDAISRANRTPKSKLGVEIFREWSERKVHEANVVLRLIRGNGNDPQSEWGELSE